jgi:hypothetical protein
MWEPRRLTTLWAFTACYRDSFNFKMGVMLLRNFWLFSQLHGITTRKAVVFRLNFLTTPIVIAAGRFLVLISARG